MIYIGFFEDSTSRRVCIPAMMYFNNQLLVALTGKTNEVDEHCFTVYLEVLFVLIREMVDTTRTRRL